MLALTHKISEAKRNTRAFPSLEAGAAHVERMKVPGDGNGIGTENVRLEHTVRIFCGAKLGSTGFWEASSGKESPHHRTTARGQRTGLIPEQASIVEKTVASLPKEFCPYER